MSLPAVSYINYGPFTSYAPAYDSTFANIGKDDSDLILASFGDESSQQGADRCVLTSQEAGGGIPDCCSDVSVFVFLPHLRLLHPQSSHSSCQASLLKATLTSAFVSICRLTLEALLLLLL